MRVISYIYDHLDSDLSLDTLAEVAALSPFHWHRVYRALSGETIADTIRRVRLSRGARELVLSDLAIADIAYRCGYPSLRSFERSFLEAYATTPSKFRVTGRSPPPLAPLATSAGPEVAVSVEELAPMRLAALLHVGPFEELGATMHKAIALAKTRGMAPLGPPMSVFLTESDGVNSHDRRAEAGFPVNPDTKITSPFHAVEVAGGRYAVGLTRGPYASLPAAWDSFVAYCYVNLVGELRDAPTFEVYVDDPNETLPSALATHLYLPLQ
ncbi:MAG: GyrI-like domain-containing protein [Vicinamibacterales bacterium]